jgi:uncharacterized membrane protein
MAFCKNCGKQLEEGLKFCPSCGTAADGAAQTASAGASFADRLGALNDTSDTTAAFETADIEQNKVMGILAYLGILVLVPLFAAPNSKFARFHANQGLVLVLAAIAYSVAVSIISAVIMAIAWRLGFLSSILGLLGIVFLVLAIIGIINAANGKAKELPIIGKITILK